MKRILTGALAALLSFAALAATTTPVQLLNPTGSTAGQAIISNGPSSAPTWGAVPLSGITGTLAVANGGTGATTAANARTNLGLGTSATVNTGTSGATIPLLSTANTWTLGQAFTVRPTFNGATPYDSANLANSANLAGALSDETGTGFVVFSASPALTGTPTSPTATAGTNTTQIATTAFVTSQPTINQANLVGTTTNNNAAAGSVGEYICAQVTNGGSPTGCATNSSTPVSLSSGVTANVTSISLTAGDWYVWGSVSFLPAGTTVTSSQGCWTSTTSATTATAPNFGSFTFTTNLPSTAGGNTNTYSCGAQRLSLSGTTTVYIEAFSGFATSTQTAYGFIGASRRR